jgi:hypothetical protein
VAGSETVIQIRAQGHIYIVAPAGECPYWLRRSHPRIHLVDQDALFPEDDRDVLPTFNTNAIEQVNSSDALMRRRARH